VLETDYFTASEEIREASPDAEEIPLHIRFTFQKAAKEVVRITKQRDGLCQKRKATTARMSTGGRPPKRQLQDSETKGKD
jgi:hypothetical protein